MKNEKIEKRNNLNFDEIMKMRNEGYSETEIAEKFDVSIYILRHFIGKTIRERNM